MTAANGEHTRLLDKAATAQDPKDVDTTNLRTYPQRWYMLAVLCCLSFEQGFIWNNYGPIYVSVNRIFGWSESTIALMANWGPICYLIAAAPTAWLLAHNFRAACVLASGITFLGGALRCFTVSNPAVTVLTHLGQIFNGLAGPVGMAAAPTLSSRWFPVEQRVTATALASVANYVGVALSFIIGTALVPSSPSTSNEEIQNKYLIYMYGEGAFSGLVFLATLVYFPSKPPHAPTITANVSRSSFLEGFKSLVKNRSFWVSCLAYGSMTGVFAGWSAYLLPNLKNVLPEDKAQSESAWIGFYSTIAGCVAGVGLSVVVDRLGGWMKIFLVGFSLFSSGAFLWFALVCGGYIELHTAYIYASSIIGGMLINGTIPVFYEAAIEVAYPTNEATTTSLMTTINNMGTLLFLIFPMFPQLGDNWVNWFLVGSCVLSVLLMTLFREDYRRLSIDKRLSEAYINID